MPAIHFETNRAYCPVDMQRSGTGEEELTGLTSGRANVLVDRFANLLRRFEAHGMSGFLLANGGSVDGRAVRCDVLYPEPDDVAAAKPAIDCQVEERKIPDTTLDLRPGPDRPDLLGPQRRLGVDNFPLIPRYLAGLQCDSIHARLLRFRGREHAAVGLLPDRSGPSRPFPPEARAGSDPQRALPPS